MNSSERKTKTVENICPIFKKRNKTEVNLNSPSKLNKFNVELEKENSNPSVPEFFNLMGLGMLSSDESSNSAASAFAAATGVCFGGDENSNEATPNLDAPKLHLIPKTTTILNDSITDNACFLDPNETLKPTNFNVNNNIRSPLSAIMTNSRPQTAKPPTMAVPSTSSSSTTTSSLSTFSSLINSRPSTSAEALSSVKKQVFADSGFFLYRQRNRESSGPDYFSRLSDEIVLEIFKWLPKKALIRCSSVCRKFNQLTADESLWTRLDLGGKHIRAGAFSHILSRGVIIFRLAQCEMVHPTFDKKFLDSYPDYQSKLQYLDLSMVSITKLSLKQLLGRCRQLKKLSLEHVPINDEICDQIAKNINLESLNLAMCEGLQSWSVRHLMTELVNLNSLNISWTWLSVDAINALVSTITPNLLRLNMAGCRKTMFDSHLLTLSKRCKQLLELDLSDCTGLTAEAMKIVFSFQSLGYLSLSRCYGISATSYMDLNKLPSLQYLDVFGILSDNALRVLEHSFPNIGINKFIHSSVARPTVGTRRTSIWGLRTRD
ncbi:SKP2 family protein [Megaselia abdita]